MASMRPRIEEVPDEDDFDVDNMEFDPEDFDPRAAIIRPANVPTTSSSASNLRNQAPPPGRPFPGQPAGANQTKYISKEEMEAKFKHYQCIYPIYFDASRSKADGRRVGKELAVKNPLASEIHVALQTQGFQVIFEPGKTHPRDWANPGRIRVLVKENGEPVHPTVKNKRQLFLLVGAYLKSKPTTPEMAMALRMHGMPFSDKPPQPPAVPKGWKISEIVPLHSPALSGGGVSDNIFKEMMNEMGGGGGAGGEPSGAITPKEKKEKKKKK